jgi:adenylate cyclase
MFICSNRNFFIYKYYKWVGAKLKCFKKKNSFLIFFFCLLVFLILFRMASLGYLRRLEAQQIAAYKRRFESYLLADELRQSSDDMTSMVRQYVMTGEKKYKDAFFQIHKIRDGEAKRPINYEQVFWDLAIVSDKEFPLGNRRSLKDAMIEQKFTIQEFNLLLDAIDEDDALTDMETAAINARDGLFDDGSGKYNIKREPDQNLAQSLVFGPEYMLAKARIMAPIQEFLMMVDQRTEIETELLNKKTNIAMIVSFIIAVLSATVLVIAIVKTLVSLTRLNAENEKLLLNVLPVPIAQRLKEGEEIIADRYPQVSVLFADIVNFTSMTHSLGPTNIVKVLNEVFALFDSLTEQYKIEKIKTIGDNYMAVAGVPVPDTNHAINLANFALAIREKLGEFNSEHHLDLQIRIGMSYGTVIAGVIGQKKFVYDLWGDGVNIASRMESTGEPGKIHVSEKLKMLLDEEFEFEEIEAKEIKGVGSMKTFFLIKKKEKKLEQY